jgi:hypothetical protein
MENDSRVRLTVKFDSPRAARDKEMILMPVRFDCPHCKANYEVVDDLVGKMIMCRVCKKRATVRSVSGTMPTPSLTTTATASKSSSADTSRRNFIVFASIASLGAIGLGALLARQPWRRWGKSASQSSAPGGPQDQPGRRRRDPQDGKKDDKGGGA